MAMLEHDPERLEALLLSADDESAAVPSPSPPSSPHPSHQLLPSALSVSMPSLLPARGLTGSSSGKERHGRRNSTLAATAIQRLVRGWATRRQHEPSAVRVPATIEETRRQFWQSDAALEGIYDDDDETPPPAPLVSHGNCLVLGSLTIDLRAEAESSWPEGGMPTVGTLTFAPGGAGANEAVALAKLGVSTKLVGRVGTDEMGRLLLGHLDGLGLPLLDFSAVRVAEGATTGVAVQLATHADGRAAHMVCQGANSNVGQVEVQAALALLPDRRARASSAAGLIGASRAGGYAVSTSQSQQSLPQSQCNSERSLPQSHGSSWLPSPAGSQYDSSRAEEPSAEEPRAEEPSAGEDVQLVLLQLELPSRPMRTLARAARKRGCSVALRASPLPRGNAHYKLKAEALLRAHVSTWGQTRPPSTAHPASPPLPLPASHLTSPSVPPRSSARGSAR